MIDHVSISVADLGASTTFYEHALAVLGYRKIVARESTVGFGKKYPEFWLNHRPGPKPRVPDTGTHICLRARSREIVDEFWRAALDAGGGDFGAPGLRPDYSRHYYAAFIKDLDGHVVEAVTFIKP